MMDEIMTICDICASEIPLEESNVIDNELHDKWGQTACNDCYGETVMQECNFDEDE